ncbi:MAG: sulfite exporter TauE/SafE family protein [Armatimonadetes bacterium]|nr:sulfite exporter TauE/SafE family protein [Armatimonadota bacterium]MDW8028031.1 sulfite exporter TauE/SafE family protein [Armatimonadota bacterium]
MDWQQMTMAIIIGLAGGVVSGLFGVGGAVIIVPSLTFFMGMSQHKAQGTSLASLLLPVGFLGFWEYYRKGNADIRLGFLIAVGLVVGAFLGAYLAQWLPSSVMRKAFGIF